MKYSKVFYLIILIAPWLTVPFMGKKALKTYLPAAIFIATFTKAIDIFGEQRRWWKFYKGIPPLNSMNSFNLGPYLVTSLWILKWTYGKFRLYMMVNVILHIIFIAFGLKNVKRYRLFSLKRMSKLQYFLIDFMRAILLYIFQWINELNRKKTFYN